MNNKFLLMVATICGGVVILALLLLPMLTADEVSRNAISMGGTGAFLLMFGWVAGGFAAMLFLKMNARIGMSDQGCGIASLLGFKLLAFFLIAHLIDGSGHMSWGIGFWLTFLASIVGAFALYLTFNPKLAAKIAEAAKSDDKPAEDKPAEDKPADT